MPIRIVLADSRSVVRAGLASFFVDSEITVVAEAQNVESAVKQTLALRPDAVLLGLDFSDGEGFDAATRLRRAETRSAIVFLGSNARMFLLARAIASGADSYLMESTSRAEIIRVIQGLVEFNSKTESRSPRLGSDEAAERIEALGEYAGELRRVAFNLRRRLVEPFDQLTERESQVLRHIAMGLSNKEIAASLNLSLDTVKEHVRNILRKLDVRDRAQAAVWAVRSKLIS